jgi:hypothetical protein
MQSIAQYLLIVDFDLSQAPEAYEGWQSYAGFDGWVVRANQHWEPLLRSLHRVPRVEERSNGMIEGPARGAYISNHLDTTPPMEGFTFLGFDAGMYFNEYGHYSLLLHYVSRHRGGWELNKHMLFDRADDAGRLIDTWLAWTPEIPDDKEGVAPGDIYQPFAVFASPPLPHVVH